MGQGKFVTFDKKCKDKVRLTKNNTNYGLSFVQSKAIGILMNQYIFADSDSEEECFVYDKIYDTFDKYMLQKKTNDLIDYLCRFSMKNILELGYYQKFYNILCYFNQDRHKKLVLLKYDCKLLKQFIDQYFNNFYSMDTHADVLIEECFVLLPEITRELSLEYLKTNDSKIKNFIDDTYHHTIEIYYNPEENILDLQGYEDIEIICRFNED